MIEELDFGSRIMFADEMPIQGTSIADIDLEYYKGFIKRKYYKDFEDLGIELRQSLENLNLLKERNLDSCGVAFFQFKQE